MRTYQYLALSWKKMYNPPDNSIDKKGTAHSYQVCLQPREVSQQLFFWLL